MPGPTAADHWQQVWQTREVEATSWYEPVPAASLRLIEHTGVPPTAPLIDVGGGASTLVDALLDRGWSDLTVLDIAEAAFAAARARLGGRAERVRWLVADVTRWTPDRRWVLWHDRAVFHFLVDPDDRRAYRSALLAGLAEDGWAIVATFAPDGPPRCSGLPVERYDPQRLRSFFAPELELVQASRHVHHTPAGQAQPFIYGLFRRRAGPVSAC